MMIMIIMIATTMIIIMIMIHFYTLPTRIFMMFNYTFAGYVGNLACSAHLRQPLEVGSPFEPLVSVLSTELFKGNLHFNLPNPYLKV